MDSEANLRIIVESVVNETSRLCQCELTAEQIRDTTLMCSSDSNAVTFRASLIGSETITSAAILDNTAVWVMDPSSSITVQGRRLSLNPNCDVHISSFDDDSCTLLIGMATNVAAIVVPIVIVVLLICIYLLVMALIFLIRRERQRKQRYTIYE